AVHGADRRPHDVGTRRAAAARTAGCARGRGHSDADLAHGKRPDHIAAGSRHRGGAAAAAEDLQLRLGSERCVRRREGALPEVLLSRAVECRTAMGCGRASGEVGAALARAGAAGSWVLSLVSCVSGVAGSGAGLAGGSSAGAGRTAAAADGTETVGDVSPPGVSLAAFPGRRTWWAAITDGLAALALSGCARCAASTGS